ncbi:Chromatin-remodeling complexes subunit ngg1 [Smittium mucronatum]|uniref:Chromatin-remodeling complexes subunit ngg1 n=1 Tax=Smittium mucronatum TaxID=133383 RepID=A0A1R0GTZ8_9FUNG|nr:Chromatin-remodeling complexes subunit ngg1 [Smittium mucronatum]
MDSEFHSFQYASTKNTKLHSLSRDLDLLKTDSDFFKNFNLVDFNDLTVELNLLISSSKKRILSLNHDLKSFQDFVSNPLSPNKKIKTEFPSSPISKSKDTEPSPLSLSKIPLVHSESSLQTCDLIQSVKDNLSVDFSFLCHPFDSPTNTSDKNYKRRFKSIPENTIVPNDYSKVKVSAQIPANVFWAAMEYYLRPLTEDDCSFLENYGDPNFETAIIPKGQHYILKWANEEYNQFPDLAQASKLKFSIQRIMSPSKDAVKFEDNKPILLDKLDDSELVHPTIICPPLTERLLSSLIDQRLLTNSDLEKIKSFNKDQFNEDDYNEVPNLEDRIKQELVFLGAIDKKEIDWTNTEDDEISVELRRLYQELKSQIETNNERKKTLLPIVKHYLGYQEFRSIIDELDKQIESNYSKRNRNQKSKKKKSGPSKFVSVSSNTMALIQRRNRFIESIGVLFVGKKFENPTQSIFKKQ